MKSLSLSLAMACTFAAAAPAQMRLVALRGKSAMVDFRIVFEAGSAADPPKKAGTAWLTAMMLGQRESLSTAGGWNVQVDKEMVTFSGSVPNDKLEEKYQLLRAAFLDPVWREEDFERVRKNAIDFLRMNLRSDNDADLADKILEENIFQGTPYGHYSAGTAASLGAITLDDLKQFYRSNYCQENLTLGIAGGYKPEFLERMQQDFRRLPEGRGFRPREEPPALIQRNRAVIVEKKTQSVAISMGFPTLASRANPDYPALLLVSAYLGRHPLEPRPNLARRFQIFQMRIGPVAPDKAVSSLRQALYRLDKLSSAGISQQDFEQTRSFLTKFNLHPRSQSEELGDAIDNIYYLIPGYKRYLKDRLATLTRADVNRVIKRYLRTDGLVIVAVANHGDDLKRALTSGESSPITDTSARPAEISEQDKIVEKFPLNLRPEDITIVPVEDLFEK